MVEAVPDPPNIVLITTDDQRADDLRWMPRTRARLGRRGTHVPRDAVPAPAVLSRAGGDPDRPVRPEQRRSQQRRTLGRLQAPGCGPHPGHLALGGRLPHGPRRQAPQPVPRQRRTGPGLDPVQPAPWRHLPLHHLHRAGTTASAIRAVPHRLPVAEVTPLRPAIRLRRRTLLHLDLLRRTPRQPQPVRQGPRAELCRTTDPRPAPPAPLSARCPPVVPLTRVQRGERLRQAPGDPGQPEVLPITHSADPPRPDPFPCGRGRERRRAHPDAAPHRRAAQHRHPVHLRQRLPDGRAPPSHQEPAVGVVPARTAAGARTRDPAPARWSTSA